MIVPGIQHHIHTTKTRRVYNRQLRLPQATKDTIRGKCDEIEPSTWVSHDVLVTDGSLRFCEQYRAPC